MEVAEYLEDRGLLGNLNGSEIVSAACTNAGDLVVNLKGGGKLYVVVPLDFIRETLNINAYWEADPYNGGEKFLIVDED